MNEKKMSLFYPQWQGAGTTNELLQGANEIRKNYLSGYDLFEIKVSGEANAKIEKNILGYKTILEQMESAKEVIAADAPDRIFTVGGGCDVELLPVSYLNYRLDGNLTVLWIDAHGDLNTPESSPSKNFHGMPLRALLGEGDPEIGKTLFSKLQPDQIIMIGQRDLDEPERNYIAENGIDVLETEAIQRHMGCVEELIRSKGSEKIYIHIDLDVLDYDEFPYVMVPSPGGLKTELLMGLLSRLNSDFQIVGLSLLEYTSSQEDNIKILSDIVRMGIEL